MKFLIRFLFIFFVHALIKIGDDSHDGLFDISERGLAFSICFITYGLVVWYIAGFFNQKIENRQASTNKKSYTYMLFSFHFVFGLIVAFLANWIYQTTDVYFFDNKEEVWQGVTLFNAEFTMSLWMIYIMVFSFDSYHKSRIKNKENQLKLEKLEKDNTLAQYLNLKAQIEPHFLFNSLSVLSSLIYSDVNIASEFTLRLSRILRYVIEKNEFPLVTLKEEITFVENYLFLIQTRFEKEVVYENRIDKKLMNIHFVPPSAIQTLVENAVKHNKFAKESPLRIEIYSDKEFLIVKNNVDMRNDSVSSTKQGLGNLKARFSHFTSVPIKISKTNDEFSISLPLLTKEHYERFNI